MSVCVSVWRVRGMEVECGRLCECGECLCVRGIWRLSVGGYSEWCVSVCVWGVEWWRLCECV